MIKFYCPNCDQKIGIAPDFTAKQVRCPRCSQPVPVPEQPANDDALLTSAPPAGPAEITCPACATPAAPDTEFCIKCGHAIEQTDADPTQESAPTTFWRDLVRLAVPVRTLGEGVTFFFLFLLCGFLAFPFPSCLIVVFKFFAAGYFCAYLFTVIVETAGGDDELPGWPDITDAWDDVLRPFLLFAGASVIAFLPAIIIGVIFAAKLHRSGGEELDATAVWILTIFGYLGLFCWPMVMLGAALGDNLTTVRPDLVIRSIINTIGPYIACCACLLLCAFLWQWAYESFADDSVGSHMAAGVFQQIGSLCLSLYAMRAIGLLYRHYKHKLAWAFG